MFWNMHWYRKGTILYKATDSESLEAAISDFTPE